MTIDNLSDGAIADILKSMRVWAVVGASQSIARPVYGVMEFLIRRGYEVVPVNPTIAGETVLGLPVSASLGDVDRGVEVVDVFRNSAAAGQVVDDAIREKDRLGIKVVWMQLGVINQAAAERGRAAGLTVVMDRCPKIEAARLLRG